jgi:beta-phosphoglucomutase
VILDVLDVGDCFQSLVSAEEVPHGKPAPDVFLLAAERLGVSPSRCVVVEDAPAGVEAGRRAGMQTIGIASMGRALEADVVVSSLDRLAPQTFDDLVAMNR